MNAVTKILNNSKFLIYIVLLTIFAFVFKNDIPHHFKEVTYTVSQVLRECLVFTLPFLVFPLVVNGILNVGKKATYLIIMILIAVIISGSLALFIPYAAFSNVIPLMGFNKVELGATATPLNSLFPFELNIIFSIEYCVISAILLGICLNYINSSKISSFFDKWANFTLKAFSVAVMPIIAFYLFGGIIKVAHDTDLGTILEAFGMLIVLIIVGIGSYISLLFLIANSFDLSKTKQAIRNCMEPAAVAFSTMSSLVTLPFTLKATEKNLHNKGLAQTLITSTVNNHAIGDDIALSTLALVVAFMFTGHVPDAHTYLLFCAVFGLAQLSAVSIPGGTIILMMPFLESSLGFSQDMMSLMVSLAIFLDCFGTCGNVLGNCAFAMIIKRFLKL